MKKVIIISALFSLLMMLLSRLLFQGDWPFGVHIFLVGVFISFTLKDKSSRDYLLKLLVASIVFSFLTVLFISFQTYFRLLSTAYPMPFYQLITDESLSFLAFSYFILSILGGLTGIIFKGSYSFYGKRLDRVMLFGGPLLLSAFSLFVTEQKIGGTQQSFVYGWPYSFLIHQVRDVIDGTLIDKWQVMLGSFGHYLIFDYLFYLLILSSIYYAIKLFNKKKNIINPTFVLFAVLVVGLISFSLYLPLRQNYIFKEIDRANYCEKNSDCSLLPSSCPFGCFVAVNKAEVKRIDSLINSYQSDCIYSCIKAKRAKCIDKRCEIEI